MSGDEVVLACAKQDKKQEGRKKKADNTLATTCVKLLLGGTLCVCGLVFFMFNGTLVFNSDMLAFNGYNSAPMLNRSMTTSFVADSSTVSIPGMSGSIDGTISGKGTGKSQFTDYDVYTYNEELYQEFLHGPVHDIIISKLDRTVDERGAKTLSAIMTYSMQKKSEYGFNFAIGVLVSVLGESSGVPGLLQGGHHPPNWPGGDQILTAGHIASVKTLSNGNPNSDGFGLCQWTYSGYLKEYAPILEAYLPPSGTMSQDDIRAADLTYLFGTVFPKARDVTDVSSPSQAGLTFAWKYEMSGREWSGMYTRQRHADVLAGVLKKYDK